MPWKVTSRYYRVVVLTTMEEQIFSTLSEAREWVEKVRHTFADPNIPCEIVLVTEMRLV